ncbi:HDOD domain-containing protein [Colwellia sp. BRX10-3]|uniref:HDOD domain-containing protein n=1 Tax=Colwellia sp. BRX10-3 TaxID=2759844 RepID=UPI0015F6FAC5|nr:HDOD domain-containing protein [Colwellia sp. BRX10-3]MBA6391540.1 HDOD domain-containing protein [Colwellia sp. BRX10-3]
MKDAPQISIQHWVDIIAKSELPAITSTARMLDKFNNDDKSSLPKLSKAILHDQALASCLLKVANSVQHLSINKVNTVSRASVVLGIRAVKNICLTSKLVEGLLDNKELNPDVHHQLTQSMASSFYAGLLAKMMAPQYADDTQEELYLAAMLYRIGETAFWCVGGESADNLIAHGDMTSESFRQKCFSEIGGDFAQLSTELVKTWSLSDLLLKALDKPKSRTIEIQIIYFADKLSNTIANPTGSVEEFHQLLADIAKLTGLNERQLTLKIESLRENANKLLTSYGASALIKHIKPLPNASDFKGNKYQVLKPNPHKYSDIISTYMQLNKLLKSSTDLTSFIQLTLKSMAKIFAFEHCSFFLMIEDKAAIKSRFTFDIASEIVEKQIKFSLSHSNNVFSYAMDNEQAILIKDRQEKQWYQYITGEIAEFIAEGSVLICPVKVGQTPIGAITAQVFLSNKEISLSDFDHCAALVEQLNLCLTMLSHKNK